MAHDVFISYAAHGNDKVVADAVCARLEQRGIRCWIAPRDCGGAHPLFPAAIDAGILGSRVFVLVFSGNANKSDYVVRELTRATGQGIPVVPLRIENALPEDAMALLLAATNWLDALTPPLERHLDKLADRVQLLLGPAIKPVEVTTLPSPSPPPPWWRVILATLTRHRRRTAILGTIAIAAAIAVIVVAALQLQSGKIVSTIANDPGFELSAPDGTFPSSGYWQPAWLGSAGAVCTLTAAHAGSVGLWVYTGSAAADWWCAPYQDLPAAAGEVFACSAWVRSQSSWVHGSKAFVRVAFLNSAGTAISPSQDSRAISTAESGWQLLSVQTSAAPAGTAYLRISLRLEKPNGASGQSIANFDD